MNCLTGAVGHGIPDFVYLDEKICFLETKESSDDYAALLFSVDSALSSLALPCMLDSELVGNYGAVREDIKLQMYYFHEYMESCAFIKHDSCPDELIEKGMLDMKRFPALTGNDIQQDVRYHIYSLQELNFIHQFYAFRKALANCEFKEWDQEFSKISNSGTGWFVLSRSDLHQGFHQNRSLLEELKKDTGSIDPAANYNICETLSGKLMEKIDREYSNKLLKFNEEFNKRRIERYNDHIKFIRLLKNRASEAQGGKIRYLSKDYHLTAELKPQSVHNYTWNKESLNNAWILEKVSIVKGRVGRKYLGGLSNSLSKLVMGGATVFALATMSKSKK